MNNNNIKFKNKNLLFYRTNHQESSQFLTELNKNEPLKNQFILINQDDKQIIMPTKIKELGESLILIVNGSSTPIVGKDAIYWILNGGFSTKANGLEYFAFNKDIGTLLGDTNASLVNGGVTTATSGKTYCPIGTTQLIETTVEPNTRIKGDSVATQKLNQLITERNKLDASQRGGMPMMR